VSSAPYPELIQGGEHLDSFYVLSLQAGGSTAF
jgi:hypothetical protein